MPEGDIYENDKGERVVLRGGQWVPMGAGPGQAPAPAQPASRPSGIVFGQPPARQVAADQRAERGDQREDVRLRLAVEAAERARAKDDAATDPNATYQDRYDRVRADKDIARLEAAGEGARTGATIGDTAEQAEYWLNRGAPTGPFADERLAFAKAVPALGGLVGLDEPRREALENFTRVSSGMALDNASKLKGPMSDKDIIFLKATVASAGASPQANRAAIAAQQWAARRAKNYEAALQSWTQTLGRPSALNASGQSFDGWWAQWSAERDPPPGSTRRPSAPRVKPAGPKPAAVDPTRGRAPTEAEEGERWARATPAEREFFRAAAQGQPIPRRAPAAAAAPARPKGVPADARWDPKTRTWVK